MNDSIFPPSHETAPPPIERVPMTGIVLATFTGIAFFAGAAVGALVTWGWLS